MMMMTSVKKYKNIIQPIQKKNICKTNTGNSCNVLLNGITLLFLTLLVGFWYTLMISDISMWKPVALFKNQ